MLQQDGLAVGARQGGGDDVAELEPDLGIGVVRSTLGDHELVQATGLAGEAVDPGETVAAVDPGVHGAGADAVAGIQLAVAVHRMPGAPARLRPGLGAELGAWAEQVVRIAAVELHRAQVVLVPALQVHQFPEQALADHLQHRHHVAAVAHVLQQHVRGGGFQLGLEHIPVVLQGDAGHHFAADRDPGLHRLDGHRRMPLPGRGDDHRVQPRMLQQAPIGMDVAILAIGPRRLPAGLGRHAHGALEHDRFDVAQGHDLDVVAAQQLAQQYLAARAGADHAHPHATAPGQRRPARQQGGRAQRSPGEEEITSFHGAVVSVWRGRRRL